MLQSMQEVLFALDRQVPGLRRVLPRRLVAGVAAYLEGVTVPRKPDRLHLAGEILPVLGRLGAERVLFVGCRRYTKPYEEQFSASEYWTLEIDPDHARWGAKLHKTGDVRAADALFPAGFFDLVIFNGVLGYGVDAAEDMDRAVAALRRVMRDQGILLIGWNRGLTADPLTRPALRSSFLHEGVSNLPARRVIDGSTHVFDLLRARGPAMPAGAAIADMPLGASV